jgi:hypothetical protein
LKPKSEQERAAEVREHLANKRTLLSWVRTGSRMVEGELLPSVAMYLIIVAGSLALGGCFVAHVLFGG